MPMLRLKHGRTNPMEARKFFRDGLEELITGPIRVSTTSDGHVVERYQLASGEKRYFATLSGTHWCAHGSTIAQAVADAIWKDPTRRPSMESLASEIKSDGVTRKITLNEFRLLTGACLTGCRAALKGVGKDESPLTAKEIRDTISRDWGDKLISVLGWQEVMS